MTKTEFYKQDLARFIDDFLETGDEKKIVDYLVSNSSLPSPRGNLELATAFAELIEIYSSKSLKRLWDLCMKATSISSDQAPVNDPKEFLPFCGAYAIGALGSVYPKYFDKALFRLKELAHDSRWRTREAVAMGVQKLLERQPTKTLKILEDWIENSNWLTMRAVVAGVAEPLLLRDEQTGRKALELHKKIFAKILSTKERKSSEFKTMRKGLRYTLSVIICALPKEEGFGYMYQLVDSQDVDILWILKQNLRKNRLIKKFPDEVASMKELL
jgi:hypothetical protein